MVQKRTPEPDIGDHPDPREIPPQDIYSVATKATVRVEIARKVGSNVESTDKSPSTPLDLEIIRNIKVAPGQRSQIVVAAASFSGTKKPFEAESLVVKLFDLAYLDKEELTGIHRREWLDRVRIAAMLCKSEFTMYQVLSKLQGDLIPICYGKVTLSISSDARKARNADEVHGILLQYLPIKSYVYGHEMTLEKRAEFVDKADAIHNKVLQLGVRQNDLAPRNFCVDASGRVYLLDFKSAVLFDVADDYTVVGEFLTGQLGFENMFRIYGFLPKGVDWKYWAAYKVCFPPQDRLIFHLGFFQVRPIIQAHLASLCSR